MVAFATLLTSAPFPPGRVVAWGDNTYGQTDVPVDLTNAVSVAAGDTHSLAARSDGTVVGWGDNTYQQTTVPQGVSNIVAVYAGEGSSMALRNDGRMFYWGIYSNYYGDSVLTNVAWAIADHCVVTSNQTVLDLDGNRSWRVLNEETSPFAFGWACVAVIRYGNVEVWSGQRLSEQDLGRVKAMAGYGTYLGGPGANITLYLLLQNGLVKYAHFSAAPEARWHITAETPLYSNVEAIDVGWALTKFGTVCRIGVGSLSSDYTFLTEPSFVPGLSNAVAISSSGAHVLAILGDRAPAFVSGPSYTSVYTGRDALLKCTVAGTPPITYQWSRDGVAIEGATNATLLLPAVRVEDAGYYAVTASNFLGRVESEPASVVISDSVLRLASITDHWALAPGSNLTLKAEVLGSGPISCQWRKFGKAVNGATNLTFAVSNAAATDAGFYTVVFTNPFGSLTTAVARVYLPHHFAFTNADDPRVWEFTLLLPGSKTTGGGSSVHVQQLTGFTEVEKNFWPFGGIYRNYSCRTILKLDEARHELHGFTSCTTTRVKSMWPGGSQTLGRTCSRSPALIQIPDSVKGNWDLTIELVPNGQRYEGSATVVIDPYRIIGFRVTGHYSANTLVSSVNLTADYYRGSALSLKAAGEQATLEWQSCVGKVFGQSVLWRR